MSQKTNYGNIDDRHRMTGREKTVRLAKMGMLVAISVVLVYFIHFPIFPAVSPQSIDRVVAVMDSTFLDARNSTHSAISDGRINLALSP